MDKRKKKRIAILTNYPADGKSFTGGVETATEGLLEGLRDYQSDFEFHVVSLSNRVTGNQVIERDGFQFHFIAIPKNPFIRPHLPYNTIKALQKIREISPDLIHCQDNMVLAVASILSGYPRIFTVHGIKGKEAILWRGREYWSHQMDRILERFVHQRTGTIISVSPYVSKLLNHNKRIFEIPNPLTRLFYNFENLLPDSKEQYILYIGPLIHLKQPLILIYAYIELKKDFPNLKLILCGSKEDPKYYNIIKAVIHKNSLTDISFLENLSRKEIRDYLAKAKALVLPSIQENSPMVIAEAMAVGTPIVAARVGGIPYMIEHRKTGFLFESGNIGELANCIKLLLEDQRMYKFIRYEAREKAKRSYQPENIAAKTVAVYRKLMIK